MKLRRRQPENPPRPRAAEVLGIPEAEREEVPFDPDRDITTQEWQTIRIALRHNLKEYWKQWMTRGAEEDLEAAAADVLLHPEMGKRWYRLSADQVSVIESLIKENLDEMQWGEYDALILLQHMIALKPNWTPNDLWLDKDRIKQILAEVQNPGDSLPGLQLYGHGRLAFPENLPPVSLSDTEWEEVKSQVDADLFSEGHINSAAFMILAVPSRREDLYRHLTPRHWVEIRRLIDFERREKTDVRGLAPLALQATLLAADKVEITGPGQLKIIKRFPFVPLPIRQPLPERPLV